MEIKDWKEIKGVDEQEKGQMTRILS